MFKYLISCVALLSLPLTAFAAKYEIDSSHSNVAFKIKHLTISNVSGKFAEFSGTYNFDPAQMDKSNVEAEITVASITTNQQKRDDHLRSEDFFDAQKFPKITYKSKSVTKTGEKTFKVEGDLTIHGITKSVPLEVTFEGAAKDPWGNDRTGFSAVAHINRKDFGMTWNKLIETGGLVVGEDVTINLEVEGNKVG